MEKRKWELNQEVEGNRSNKKKKVHMLYDV